MDIELLSKMVGELILDRDEVGLPGFGSFVAEIVPASFSDRGYTINPPYRRLTFLPGKSEDDSLSELYARSNDIDLDQAKSIIRHFLTETRKVLQDTKTVVFPGLGCLRATKDNRFFFVTDEELDIFPDGFGLQSVSLKTRGVSASSSEAASSQPIRTIRFFQEELAPEPELEPDSKPTPEPEPVPEPIPEPAFEPEPIIELELAPELDPESIFEPELDSTPVPESEPALEPGPIPEPESEPASEPEPEPEPAPEAAPIPVSAPHPKPVALEPKRRATSRTGKIALKVVLWLLCLTIFLLALFVVVSYLAPEFTDSILYTPEELHIINY